MTEKNIPWKDTGGNLHYTSGNPDIPPTSPHPGEPMIKPGLSNFQFWSLVCMYAIGLILLIFHGIV